MVKHCEACMKIAAENHRISCLSKNYYYKLIRANCQHVIIERSFSEQITRSNREIREDLIVLRKQPKDIAIKHDL